MPSAALRPCPGDPRCPHLVGPDRRCPDHPHGRRPWADRPSARARGYTYAWDKAAREMRERGELCRYCHHRIAVHLDHHVPLSEGGSPDPKLNGVPACERCHRIKSAAEAARGRARNTKRTSAGPGGVESSGSDQAGPRGSPRSRDREMGPPGGGR